jgi:TetR/AcrR family transcriptional regulator, lmrAB and yxaGH operons repressor
MPRGTTKHRLLSTAADLLHRQGYASTGLNQVLAEARAPRGSLYFHFPGGKEELMAEALTGAARGLTELLERTLRDAPSAEVALYVIVDYFRDQLERSQFQKGCPVATVALEQSAVSDPLHHACSQAYTAWEALIAGRLVREGIARPRADELAAFILASIEGALILCRAHRSTAPLERVGVELRRLLTRKDDA